jgi:hypothetical protein
MVLLSEKGIEMELTIDGQPVAIETEGINTFKDLIERIERDHIAQAHVVTKMVLNGEEIDEGQEIGLGAFSMKDIASLAIETADKIELANEALEDAQEYLPQLSAFLEQAARMIREGNTAEGLNLASEALDVISAFGEVLEGIRITFQLDFAEVKIEEFNLLEKLNELGTLAKEILKSAQDENWTLFADLTEYELSPLLYEWMAVIPSLVDILPTHSGGEGDEGA